MVLQSVSRTMRPFLDHKINLKYFDDFYSHQLSLVKTVCMKPDLSSSLHNFSNIYYILYSLIRHYILSPDIAQQTKVQKFEIY